MTDGAQAQFPPPPPSEDVPAWTVQSLAGRPQRLSAVVVADLVDRVVSGGYPSGHLLPPEPALCRSFGVSRSVVREALKVLEEKGLVAVQQGYGTLVADPEDWNLIDPIVLAAVVRHDGRRRVIDDLIGVRAVLESAMAARAAALRTDDDIASLRGMLRQLEATLEEATRHRALDTRFHDEIMRISGNRLARAVVHSIHEQARSSAGYNDYTPDDLQYTHLGHTAILEQIEAGNRDGAAAAMREHIIAMWHRKRDRPARAEGAQTG